MPAFLGFISPSKPARSESVRSGERLLLSVALISATLWDYRLFDARVFDGLALLCFGLFLALRPEPFLGFIERRRDTLLLFATIAFYAIVGIVLQGHRSSYAILALACVAFALIGRRDWLTATSLVQWLLTAHLTFFAIQFLSYYLFNTVIDFQSVFGAQSRMTERHFHIRGAGLFQEPNSFCVNAFILGTLATLNRSSWVLVLLTACAMALSESAWGLVAAFVLMLLDALSRFPVAVKAAKHFFTLALVTLVVFNAHLWLTKEPRETVPFFYTRMLNIATDPSLRERYLQNACSDKDPTVVGNFISDIPLPSLIFGGGLSTRYFLECLPVNGFAFLIRSLGLIGFIFLMAGLLLALRRVTFDKRLYALVAIGFSFSTYPLATYLIFWIWLPALIGLLHLHQTQETEHAPPQTNA